MVDTAKTTATEIAAKVAAKEWSAEEVVRAYLERVDADNGKLNALIGVAADVLEQARAIDARIAAGEDVGPLAGVPVVLKDNMLVKGWHASAGSQMLENYDAAYDATVVKKLRAAGAVLLGRGNMDEFAMGSSTESSHFGPTRNPWDVTRVPGGSSGGSAVAVAAGFVPLSLGSDTGGSIRQPASLCGVVGFKPTYGRVSRAGLIAMSSSLDQIGPFARTVEDAALLFDVIQGDDALDATTVANEPVAVGALRERDVKGLRIGIPREYFIEGIDERVKAAVMDAVHTLESAGAIVKEISLPHTEYALASYYVIMPSEVSSNLGRLDGIRYGFSVGGATLRETYDKSRGEGFGPEVRRRIMLGTFALSAGYYDAYYRKALQMRSLIKQDFDEAFKEVDVIATPTSPCLAWKLGEKSADPLTMYLADIYTVSANMATIPGLSVPCGFADGLPIGLQFMARAFDEASLFRVGGCYQDLTEWHLRQP